MKRWIETEDSGQWCAVGVDEILLKVYEEDKCVVTFLTRETLEDMLEAVKAMEDK